MLARLQQFIVFALLLAAAGVAAVVGRQTTAGWGIAAGFALIFGYAAVLAAELLCLWCVEGRDARPSSSDLFRAWWGEVLNTPRVFCWRQPFRSQAVADLLPAAPDGRRGVLLVHGLVCNRGFWTPWMRRLERLGHSFVAIDLEPVFGSIETWSPAIDRAVAHLREKTGAHPVIVAHSMGGLAVRHWLQVQSETHPVHRIITIGTPHHGTWLARFARSSSGRQMAVGSDWLRALATGETLHDRACFTCFYGPCDNVVFPSANARLEDADNRRIDRTAHVALAFDAAVFAETLRWLDSGSEPRGQ